MRKSFTLIELMIVVAIIAIIAAIAIPGLLRARISSNETSAVGSMRTTATAQSQFQSANTKDRDSDGQGEYGYFTELSGELATPTNGGIGSIVSPTFISSAFGATSVTGVGIANKSGYNYLMYLPTDVAAVAEAGVVVPSAAGTPEEVDAQETRWALYSWPTSGGNSGNKAYFINQTGEVFATNNIVAGTTSPHFTALTSVPPAAEIFDVALSTDPANIDGVLVNGTTLSLAPLTWNPAN